MPTDRSLTRLFKRLSAQATTRFPATISNLLPGSVANLMKVALDLAYLLLMIVTATLLLVFLASIFIPIANLNITVSNDSGGRQQPLTRPLLLFVVGAFTAYFGGFLLILRNLRLVLRTLMVGDPFQPENVLRLRQIGLVLAVVTVGVWLARGVVASRLAPGVMDRPAWGELLTPVFSVVIVFVLVEIFRESARLRREAELTI